MKKYSYNPLCIIWLSLLTAALLGGCSASEETEEAQPELSTAAAEENQPAVSADTTAQKKSVSPTSKLVQKPHQGFVTKYDTIDVQSSKKLKGGTSNLAVRSIKKTYYSIQIGAFRSLGNAERAKQTLSKRFDVPVSHFFDTAIKLYRVFGGAFNTKAEAENFARSMRTRYPNEYRSAWVAELKR